MAETLIIVDEIIHGKRVQCLIDTGSPVSIVSPESVPVGMNLMPYNGGEIRAVSGEKLPILGRVRTQVKIDAISRPIWVKLLVAKTNGFDCLLGNDFNRAAGITVHCSDFSVHGPKAVHQVSTRVETSSENNQNDQSYCAMNSIMENSLGLLSGENAGLAYSDFGSDENVELNILQGVPRAIVAHPQSSNDNPESACKNDIHEQPWVEEGVVEAIDSLELPDIIENQREQTRSLLKEFKENFAITNEKLGSSRVGMHGIKTGDSSPISRAPHRYSASDQEEIRKQIEEMIQIGVVRPSNSPWAGPMVLVQKPNGSKRMCVDLRKVNAVTKEDVYPLPNIDDS